MNDLRRPRLHRVIGAITAILVTTVIPRLGAAAPEGTVTWAVHVTLAPTWFDPAATDGGITPFMVLYALHDALVKPMPAGPNTASLAESWTQSEDGLTYEFVLRRGIKFHNGDPVTAVDVKFSFDRYKGVGAKLFKERVRDVQVVDLGRVRFQLKEPWPDFMTFYGTSATGAGWIVPKAYVEKVGEDGFKVKPIGAGPYRFVSFEPEVKLVMEAFDGYWRKAPNVKKLVYRIMKEETSRAAALRRDEVDIAYSLTGSNAEDVRRTPKLRLVTPGDSLVVLWIDLPEQWDAKSPWHDPRVRLAVDHAIDRQALSEAETLGLSRVTGSFVPRALAFAKVIEPTTYDPDRAKRFLAEAGYPNGFDAGDLYSYPPYFSMGDAVADYLQKIGIRTRPRPMERAAILAASRERKLQGVVIRADSAVGNAATRLEPYVTKTGTYTAGVSPDVEDLFRRQASEVDPKRRELLLHQIQTLIHERATHIPIYERASIWGVGPRVSAPANLIPGFPYSAPLEDVNQSGGTKVCGGSCPEKCNNNCTTEGADYCCGTMHPRPE